MITLHLKDKIQSYMHLRSKQALATWLRFDTTSRVLTLDSGNRSIGNLENSFKSYLDILSSMASDMSTWDLTNQQNLGQAQSQPKQVNEARMWVRSFQQSKKWEKLQIFHITSWTMVPSMEVAGASKSHEACKYII